MPTVANYAVLAQTQFGFARNHNTGQTTPPRLFNLNTLPPGTRFDRDAVLTLRVSGAGSMQITAEEATNVNRLVMSALVSDSQQRSFHYIIPAVNFGTAGHIIIGLTGGSTLSVDDVVLWFQQDV